MLFAVILTALLIPAPISAQQAEAPPDRFSLAVGGFLINHTQSVVAFSAQDRTLGTVVDLEDDLDQSGSNGALRLDTYLRLGRNHRIGAIWYHFSRSGRARLERRLDIGSEQFAVGTDVDSKTTINLVKLGYSYSFYHVEQVELAVGIGFHLIDVGFDATARDLDQETSEGGLLPLPNLGFFMKYHISSRFTVPAQFQFFFVEGFLDYRGSLTDFLVGLEYRAFRHLGLGVAFNRFVLEASALDTNFQGIANGTFNGFQLYLVGKL